MARATNRVRWSCALLLVTALLFVVVAPATAQIPGQSDKAQKIGKRLMCMCGCNQILVECNHVGCSVSTAMLKELDTRIARNEPEDLLIQSFVQQYGEKVLAQPPAKGFSLVAWIMPFFALLLGFVVLRMLLLRWRQQTPAVAGMPGGAVISSEMLSRARQEMDLDDEFGGSGPKGAKD